MNAIIQGQDLIIGNVGDSRAVLATRDKENALVAVQLTVDLKPNLPSIPLSYTHAINIPVYAYGYLLLLRQRRLINMNTPPLVIF